MFSAWWFGLRANLEDLGPFVYLETHAAAGVISNNNIGEHNRLRGRSPMFTGLLATSSLFYCRAAGLGSRAAEKEKGTCMRVRVSTTCDLSATWLTDLVFLVVVAILSSCFVCFFSTKSFGQFLGSLSLMGEDGRPS